MSDADLRKSLTAAAPHGGADAGRAAGEVIAGGNVVPMGAAPHTIVMTQALA